MTKTLTLNMPRYKVQAPAGLLNKSSCSAPALGVAKFKTAADIILVILCCTA